MPGRNFSLTDHLSEFVDSQVNGGRHQNASEVIREALRRYQDSLSREEAYIEEIRAAALVGIRDIEQGRYTDIRSPADARSLRRRINDRVRERLGTPEHEPDNEDMMID
jgi:antitoxin ParD1/3/4